MLQSPLKKNKYSYPINFSSKRKSNQKEAISQSKYDKIGLESEYDINPEFNINRLNDKSVKIQHQHQQNILNSLNNHYSQNNNFLKSQFQLNNEEPLRQVKRNQFKHNFDENLLQNPRFQINEQKTMRTHQKTFQSIEPKKESLQIPSTSIGSIKHQNIQKLLEKFQNVKQSSLEPQNPFEFLQNQKRNSLLERFNLKDKQQKSINNSSFSNSFQQNKIFRPESYTYANKFLSGPQSSRFSQSKRSNSSFEVRNPENILYMNTKHQNNQFRNNLPNFFSTNSFNKSKQLISTQDPLAGLENKFSRREIQNRLIPTSNKSVFANLDPDNINEVDPKRLMNFSNLKSQIDQIARNRLRNRNPQSKNESSQRQFTFSEIQKGSKDQRKSVSEFESLKKNLIKLQITYHVSLPSLKSLITKYLASPESFRVAFKVPKIFLEQQIFHKNQSKDELHEHALLVFEALKISPKNLAIKRYQNCIIFISGHICLMWHFSGKRYLGGWQYDYLDEGSRTGLGLQWQPNHHIYYGQFKNNKKHGLGTIKNGPQQVEVGYWSYGQYIGIKEVEIEDQCSDIDELGSEED